MPGTFLSFKIGLTLRRGNKRGGWRLRTASLHSWDKRGQAAPSLPIEEETRRLTWNGGCDCWLDGVGLLHKGLDAGDKGLERVKIVGAVALAFSRTPP